MIRVLVFDLDDTLYDESQFVRGGMRAAAKLIAHATARSERVVERWLLARVQQDRNGVFDDACSAFDLQKGTWLRRLVSAYRGHTPRLRLLPDAARCLHRFRHVPLYVVTDGNARVQEAKARALGLPRLVQRVLPTHRWGRVAAKPATVCFERILAAEGCTAREALYVGDNPAKDFVGIRRQGWRTVRVLRGPHANIRPDAAHAADADVRDLDALNLRLLARLSGTHP